MSTFLVEITREDNEGKQIATTTEVHGQAGKSILETNRNFRKACEKQAPLKGYLSLRTEENCKSNPLHGVFEFITADAQQQYGYLKEALQRGQAHGEVVAFVNADGYEVKYTLKDGVVQSHGVFPTPAAERKFIEGVKNGEVTVFLPDMETRTRLLEQTSK